MFILKSVTYILFLSNPIVEEIVGQKRDSMLFKNIVNSERDVAIGPLEYCGNGTVIRMAHGKKR